MRLIARRALFDRLDRGRPVSALQPSLYRARLPADAGAPVLPARNGFKIFIVSGGGIEFMRPWTEKVYGIPPEQVVGSSGMVKFLFGANGNPELMKLAKIEFVD